MSPCAGGSCDLCSISSASVESFRPALLLCKSTGNYRKLLEICWHRELRSPHPVSFLPEIYPHSGALVHETLCIQAAGLHLGKDSRGAGVSGVPLLRVAFLLYSWSFLSVYVYTFSEFIFLHWVRCVNRCSSLALPVNVTVKFALHFHLVPAIFWS